MSAISPKHSIEDLLYLMTRLRDPMTGCPWDIKQDFESIVPSTIEEAYEVAEAIEQRDYPHLKEELGDLLFQVMFYSQLGREQGLFDFGEIVHTLVAKLVRRHPHVFPAGTLASQIGEKQTEAGRTEAESAIKQQWEALKQQEREAKGSSGVLADVGLNLPALTRAAKLQKRASRVGFDWPEVQGVLAKIDEELAEVREALAAADTQAIHEELGDLLFAVVNLCRHQDADGETVLRAANRKFERRFGFIEGMLAARGTRIEDASLEEMDVLWEQAKSQV